MKKIYIPVIMLTAFAVLTCDIPSSIRIKGNPKLRFSANMDFSDLFSENVESSFDGDLEIFSNTKTKNQTYVIHMELFEEDLDDSIDTDTGNFNILGDSFQTLAREDLSDGDIEAISLDGINDLLNDFLFGFSFKSVNAALLVSGSDIVKILSIDLKLDGISIGEMSGFSPNGGFNKEAWTNSICWPNNSVKIDLTEHVNKGKDLSFSYEVFIPQDTIVPKNWLEDNDKKIKAELVIWLPMEFIAGNKCKDAGADILFPDDFFGGGDLFFRKELKEDGDPFTDMIQSLNLIIEMNDNPFEGAVLIVRSTGDLEIRNTLKGSAMNFIVNEENMAKINQSEYFPFAPKFTIHLNSGSVLELPQNFKINTICFDAMLDYTYNFQEGE